MIESTKKYSAQDMTSHVTALLRNENSFVASLLEFHFSLSLQFYNYVVSLCQHN